MLVTEYHGATASVIVALPGATEIRGLHVPALTLTVCAGPEAGVTVKENPDPTAEFSVTPASVGVVNVLHISILPFATLGSVLEV